MVSEFQNNLIVADNLSFSYPGPDGLIFKDINLSVKSGQVVGIVGESGSGKTTLLKLLAGLEKPNSGKLTINCPTRGGFVFQSPVLLDWLDVEQNIVFPKKLLEGNDEHLERLLVDIGLESTRQKHPRELSGGMRSRVQLARSLYHKPQILYLDEAFSALDEKLRHQSNMLLKHLRVRYGFSALIVSHSVQEAVFLSDRILIIKKGNGHGPARIEHIETGLKFSYDSQDVVDKPEFHKQVSFVRDKLLRDEVKH